MAVALGFCCVGCIGLLWLREGNARTSGMGSLVWNLFLAAVPFPLAWGADALTRRARDLAAIPLGIAWLLFFPNAPYLVTDLVHLEKVDGVPLWFDALVFGAFAVTGVLLGYVSLYLIQIRSADVSGVLLQLLWPSALSVWVAMVSISGELSGGIPGTFSVVPVFWPVPLPVTSPTLDPTREPGSTRSRSHFFSSPGTWCCGLS